MNTAMWPPFRSRNRTLPAPQKLHPCQRMFPKHCCPPTLETNDFKNNFFVVVW